MATSEESVTPPSQETDLPTTAERDIAATDEFLMRLMTLAASLSGGVIFLLTDVTLGILFRLCLISLILALLCALKGRLTTEPADNLAQRKKRFAEFAAAALVAGLCLAAGGIWLR